MFGHGASWEAKIRGTSISLLLKMIPGLHLYRSWKVLTVHSERRLTLKEKYWAACCDFKFPFIHVNFSEWPGCPEACLTSQALPRAPQTALGFGVLFAVSRPRGQPSSRLPLTARPSR